MFVYLNKIYMVDMSIAGIEVVLSEGLDSARFETLYRENFEKINKEYKDCIKDFSVIDGEVCSNHRVRVIEMPSKSFLPKEEIIETVDVLSLYDLIKDLAETSSGYYDNLDKLYDGFLGFVPTFRSIKVARSTMSITINMLDDGEKTWSSRRLVKMCDDGMLRQSQFYCLIEKANLNRFDKYRLEFIKKCKINNIEYSIFKYVCNLPICSVTKAINFCEPLIVHYSYISYLFSNVITCIREVKNKYTNYEKVQSDKEEQQYGPSNKNGIFFQIQEPRVSRENAKSLLDIAEMACENCSNQEVLDNFPSSYVKQYNLPEIYSDCLKILINLIKSGDKIKFDIAENSQSSLEKYSYHCLRCDLYLYNIRVGCIFNKDMLRHKKLYSAFEIQGSKYNSIVKVVKKGVEG